MVTKLKLFFFILCIVFYAFLIPSVSLAFASECAWVEAYIVDLDTGQGVPGAKALIRCKGDFNEGGVTHQCTENTRNPDGSAMYGSCWENSGWQDVPSDGHILFGTNDSGFDCFFGNAMMEAQIPSGWTWKCTTDGSEYDCDSGSNVDADNLSVLNGGAYVYKVFYQSNQVVNTPTPIPTAIPTVIPTAIPTVIPTAIPTVSVCQAPAVVTNVRINCPSCSPTEIPTVIPTVIPTEIPTPTPTPTPIPTPTPTPTPTPIPTPTPTPTPTPIPTPTLVPTIVVTVSTPTPFPTTVVIVNASPRPTLAATGSVSSIVFGLVGIFVTIIGAAIFLAL